MNINPLPVFCDLIDVQQGGNLPPLKIKIMFSCFKLALSCV